MRETLADRLWSKVEITRGCWIFHGSADESGYGRLYASGGNGKPQKFLRAHRVAYELEIGPIPTGMSVLHRCDVPLCCKPKHLFIGTQADNVKDMYSKGRANNIGPLGEAAGNAKLTSRQVREIRKQKSSVALAKKYGISYRHLRQIMTGVRWSHLLAEETDHRRG